MCLGEEQSYLTSHALSTLYAVPPPSGSSGRRHFATGGALGFCRSPTNEWSRTNSLLRVGISRTASYWTTWPRCRVTSSCLNPFASLHTGTSHAAVRRAKLTL